MPYQDDSRSQKIFDSSGAGTEVKKIGSHNYFLTTDLETKKVLEKILLELVDISYILRTKL